MIKIWGEQETVECPWCGEKENVARVMTCRDKNAIQQFWDSVEQLDEWMLHAEVAPEVHTAIKLAILCRKEG